MSPRHNDRAAASPQRRRLAAMASVFASVVMGLCAAPAWAIDFGTLRLYLPQGQAPYAEISLSDSAGLDPADVRARVATADAYGVAGMRYVAALQSVVITPQAGPNGQVMLRLERLPAPGDVPEIDLLLLVGDRMSLALGEYRVDLKGGTREFAASPAGSRLASTAPSGATASPVTSSAPVSVATPPVERPPAMPPRTPTAAAVATAAPPATTPTAAAASPDTAEVQAALDAWAQAWSRRDVDAYLAAYTPDFAGRTKGSTHEAWAEQRRTRILAKKSISVEIAQPQFTTRGDTVVATFSQRYRGDDLVERSRKRLVLVKADNRWLIQDEGELP